MMITSISLAGGPYSVYCGYEPVNVLNQSPQAVIHSSPYDDAPGILSDGLDHYHLVTDAAGQPVSISIEKNLVLDTIRISFDDENLYSAPVDSGLSTVTVFPSTIASDGVSQALVTIIPRDAQGVVLGTGLSIEIYAASLWPGRVIGAVEDMGNGAYVVRVVSSFSGSGSVQIVVEGIALTAMPTITYEESLESGTLLEQAITLMQYLTEVDGDFDHLRDQVSVDAADEVDDALYQALSALTLLLNPDSEVHVEAVKGHVKYSIESLIGTLDLVDHEVAVQVANLIDSLLEAGRKVAMHYIFEASTVCGTCSESGERDLCKAEASLAMGDAAWQDTPPNYMEAITKYGLSIRQSLRAFENCL